MGEELDLADDPLEFNMIKEGGSWYLTENPMGASMDSGMGDFEDLDQEDFNLEDFNLEDLEQYLPEGMSLEDLTNMSPEDLEKMLEELEQLLEDLPQPEESATSSA